MVTQDSHAMTSTETVKFTDLLRKAGLITAEPPQAERMPTGGITVKPGDDDGRRYALAALKAECDKLARTPEGQRGEQANISGFNVGTLVETGFISQQEAYNAIIDAGIACGLPIREVHQKAGGGFKAGSAKGGRVIRLQPRVDIPEAFSISLNEHPTQPDDPVPDVFIAGGTFVLDIPDTIPAVWGHGQQILWASGESLIIAAGNGLGKTTIAGQLVRGRMGMSPTVLGLPIQAGRKRVLYLAMDRPQQIRRSLRRHFTEDERASLDEHLTVWQGPPPADLALNTDLLAALVAKAGADTVIIDSLKDAAIGLSEDIVGAGWNRARQRVITDGCEVLELHHNVKRSPTGADPSTISDIYGSAWITAGVGSAILLTGAPGDPVVNMRHVKQPMDELGPWQLLHDHDAGLTTIYDPVDLVEYVRMHDLCTVKDLAGVLYDKTAPAEVQKARRKLERLVSSGFLSVVRGGGRGGDPDRYQVVVATTVWDAQ